MPALVIAEKGSVAEAISAYLQHAGEGKPNKVDGCFEFKNYVVTSARGHILEQVSPEVYDSRLEKWYASRDLLPFYPPEWKLVPKQDRDGFSSKRLQVIKGALKRCDRVIHAGDADEEGQLLIDEVLYYLGNKLPVERILIKANDFSGMERAFKSAKPNSEFLGWYEYALFRSRADWAYGLNATRISSIYGGNKLPRPEGKPLSAGRVQTPVLGLVVRNHLEIENFVPVDYYTPWIDVSTDTGAFRLNWKSEGDDDRVDADGRILKRDVAAAIAAKCLKKDAVIEEAEYKPGKENPTLPFSLTDFQSLMSKKYKVGIADSLELAQSLYDKKLATYPRTDTRYFPEDQFGEAQGILQSIAAHAFGKEIGGANFSLKSAAWDNKKIENHHGIMPVAISSQNQSALASLSDLERKAYDEIVKRYIIQFYPAAEVLNTKIKAVCEKEVFRASGKTYTKRGWLDVFALEAEGEDDAGAIPAGMVRGDRRDVVATGVKDSKTTPPKRFTQGTLAEAMESIHRYVESAEVKQKLKETDGIGTVATRPATIETLFAREYMVEKKGALYPTELGMRFVMALPKEATLPDMTAAWQVVMGKIKRQEMRYADAFDKQLDWVTKICAQIRTSLDALPSIPRPGGGGAPSGPAKPDSIKGHKEGDDCPMCKKHKIRMNFVSKDGPNKGKWFVSCEGWREGCKFIEGTWDRAAPAAGSSNSSASNKPDNIKGHKEGDQCPTCNKDTLRMNIVGKDGPNKGKWFISCNGWKAGCKFMEGTWDRGAPAAAPGGSSARRKYGQVAAPQLTRN